MSIPFFKTREEAEAFWLGVGEGNEKVVRVYMPKRSGFLQAPTPGYYYISKKYAKKLNLKISQ